MMASAFLSRSNPSEGEPAEPVRFTLWIDGVGAYLFCLSERVTIGGPEHDTDFADIALLANLSRRHATIARTQEGYLLEAHSAVRVAGRPVYERTRLNANYEIELGDCVRLRFRQPTVLSATAVLDFRSDHRPSHSVDGVILMDETCLLGPGGENHVQCPDWSEPVVLFRRGGQFCCKSRSDLFVDGKLVRDGTPIAAGDVITGPDLRFRLEAVGLT